MQYHAICSDHLKALILPKGFSDFSAASGSFVSNLETLVLPAELTEMPSLPGTNPDLTVYCDFEGRDALPEGVVLPHYTTVYWKGEWETVGGVPTAK